MKKILSFLAILVSISTSMFLSSSLIINNDINSIVLKSEAKKEEKNNSKTLANLIKNTKLGSFNKTPTASEIIKRVNEVNKLENDKKLKETDVDIKIGSKKATIILKTNKSDTVVIEYKNTHKIAETVGGVLAGVVVLIGAGFLSYKLIKKQKASRKQDW
ncbi:conserved hypothetical protein [Mycoplasma leachii PG50]|uniref:Transmembrane protein n=1 Tax=Mycoplasma leachii (strain DSM 21131 / NCTC 10133 / N29 / PG50) TaxID=880447 RepID=E4PUS4_MYCLG|nr:hypothetical protein [Mycoplasma leachii]ADR24021.1 conserved hypothetical protein [Mycoplasma leachii PG50]